MNCPKCDSPDIRKFSVIYESGTTVGDFSGGAVGVSGDGGLAGGILAGSSGSQTLLAKRVTPPQSHTGAVFVIAIVAAIVTYIAVNKLSDGSLGLGFGAFTLFMVLFAALLLILNSSLVRSLPARKKLWENSWLCMKCGYAFVEEPGGSQSDYDEKERQLLRIVAAPQPVAPPAPTARRVDDSVIPCPLCGKQLWISTLKHGDNYCPHCFDKFAID
jgi:hypothetical protein